MGNCCRRSRNKVAAAPDQEQPSCPPPPDKAPADDEAGTTQPAADAVRSSSKCDGTVSAASRQSDVNRTSSMDHKGARASYEVKHRASGALGTPFPKRPMGCRLSQNCWDKIEQIFRKMDPDGSNAVTRDEARAFFQCAFGNLSVDAMFSEVDVDGSGAIDADEFIKFWVHVKKSGYKEQDIVDELEELISGGAWVDWKDGKTTDKAIKKSQYPKRPVLCRVSQKCWDQCEALFLKIDHDHSLVINREKAEKHFQGGFGKIGVDAMFNEIDEKHHGQITPKEWMKFWLQVRSAGYKEKEIVEELEEMMNGGAWVDWKDGRNVS